MFSEKISLFHMIFDTLSILIEIRGEHGILRNRIRQSYNTKATMQLLAAVLRTLAE